MRPLTSPLESLEGDAHPGQYERKHLLGGEAARRSWSVVASEHLGPVSHGPVARRLRVREDAMRSVA